MYKLVVLTSVLAVAAASPSAVGLGHLGWAGPLGVAAPWGLGGLAAPWGAAPWGAAPWGAHLAAPAVAAPVAWGAPALGAYNYRGPLSLAPGQPANILAADGRPLDTLSVNLDRAAHITAKAVSGAHILKKRSAPLLSPLALSHSARIDYPARLIAPGPVGLVAPGHLGWPAAPIAPLGLGWGGYPGRLGVGHW